jgi:hypothetical protein
MQREWKWGNGNGERKCFIHQGMYNESFIQDDGREGKKQSRRAGEKRRWAVGFPQVWMDGWMDGRMIHWWGRGEREGF